MYIESTFYEKYRGSLVLDRLSTTSFFEYLSNGSVRERKATFLIKKDFFSKSFIGPFSLRKNIRDITARFLVWFSSQIRIFFHVWNSVVQEELQHRFPYSVPGHFSSTPATGQTPTPSYNAHVHPTPTHMRKGGRGERGNQSTKIFLFFLLIVTLTSANNCETSHCEII